jgi:hypothetical protein
MLTAIIITILLILSACSGERVDKVESAQPTVTDAAQARFDAVAYTIENKPRTGAEQQLADLTNSVIMENFTFEKGRQYDIAMYLYQSGSVKMDRGHWAFETGVDDETIRLCGTKEGNIGIEWSIKQGGTTSMFETLEKPDDEKAFVTVSGIGREKFVMEEGKEYVLAYVAHAEEAKSASATDPFIAWDTINDKAEALAEYSYAHVVAVQLSDSE